MKDIGSPISTGSPEEGEECGEFRVYRAWAAGGLSFRAQSWSETVWGGTEVTFQENLWVVCGGP